MKKLLSLIIVPLLLSCGACKKTDFPATVAGPKVIVKDSIVYVFKEDTVRISELNEKIAVLQFEVNKVDALKKSNDSLKVANNKLGKELLHNKQIIENARYYLNIVNKNSSQGVFLKGWMNRALNQ